MGFNLFITFVVGVAVPAVGLFLIAGRTTGRARSLGMLGCGLLVGQGLLQMIYTATIRLFYDAFGAAGMGVLGGLFNVAAAVIGAAGLALIIGALITGRSAAGSGQPHAGATYPQGQPYPDAQHHPGDPGAPR